ncbi:MAG TPA: FAD-dependent oxidoreductase, partial [Beijerinckiaceae bacterium]|nr:FAD-dependent oxidoreductase [Beijerinckiaceae bacterium]
MNRRDLLVRGSGMATGLASAAVIGSEIAQAQALDWQREADVVVIGAGATGLTSAIRAHESGASVIVVETEADIGGHAIVSGGNVALGGGTSAQKKHGIDDSPDLLFRDLTDWSVVEPNGFPDYRYNDREIIRAFADHSAATYDWLVAHGVVFVDKAPDAQGGLATGNSVPRENHAAIMDWPRVQTGAQVDPKIRATFSSGNGLMRPLEAFARKAGIEILLEHRMMAIHRQSAKAGPVLGIAVETKGTSFNLRARKAIVIATGGSTGNVNFRRMFDPRLTEEYCGLLGMPWSNQDASGEIAAMDIGASLWGFYNQVGEFGQAIIKCNMIGSQYGYPKLGFLPGSPVFAKARATGLEVTDWQNAIMVNMIGKRFYDETGPQYTANNYKSLDPYTQTSYLNAKN